MSLLAPCIGNEVSYVTQIIDDIYFAWRAQYLVKLDGGSFAYVMRSIDDIHFAWQTQYLVKLEADFCYAAHYK